MNVVAPIRNARYVIIDGSREYEGLPAGGAPLWYIEDRAALKATKFGAKSTLAPCMMED
ncbi:MAG: hypothetical protein ACXVB1_15255 [Pseudobdellovibrionaceae bacterium]